MNTCKRFSMRLLLVTGLVSVCCTAGRVGAAVDAAAIDELVKAALKDEEYPSLSVGIVSDQALAYAKAYGVADRRTGQPATLESLYFIGSVTKVFTTTLTCVLRDQGVVRLDDPVADYLPESVTLPTDPRGAPAITLRHLATHSSGLPRLPPNLKPIGADYYAGYAIEQLYAGLAQVKLAYPTGAKFQYSNLGVGLLGHALTRATGEGYESLLIKHVLEPLGMADTRVSLSAERRGRLTTGYAGDALDEEASEWSLGCLVGAGGLVSSVPDLAKFLALQMRAGQANVQPVSGGTLTELHTLQRIWDNWQTGVGLGWLVTRLPDVGDVVWHNGGVAGHFAFVGFEPKRKLGVIVLANAGKSLDALGFALLTVVAEAAAASAPADAAGELPAAHVILDGYVAATGGAEARAKVRTMVMRGHGVIAGMQIQFEEFYATGGKYLMSMSMGSLELAQEGTDGQTAWAVDRTGAARLQTGDEAAMTLREARLDRDVNWRELYTSAQCAGMAEFAKQECFKVVLTPRTGGDETRYYDTKSHLLVGMETMLDTASFGDQLVRLEFGDYKTFDGISYPCRTAVRVAGMEAGGMEMTFTVNAVEHNVEIGTERFDLPAAVKALLTPKPTTSASRPAR